MTMEFDENWFGTSERFRTLPRFLTRRYDAIMVVLVVATGSLAAILLILGVWTALTPPKPKRAAVAIQSTVITEAFPSVAQGTKTDKIIAKPDEDSVKVVKTVAVSPLYQPIVSAPKFEATPEPVVAQTEFPSLPQPKAESPKYNNRPSRGGDVCGRHGMHRQWYDGGRRWRCVK